MDLQPIKDGLKCVLIRNGRQCVTVRLDLKRVELPVLNLDIKNMVNKSQKPMSS